MSTPSNASRTPLLAGVAGGTLGFLAAWLAVARTELGDSWQFVWSGAWFGLWIGIAASLGYGALGGRRTGGAALAAALAALLVSGGLFSYFVVDSLDGDPLSEAVLGAAVILVYWAIPLALLLLVAPAVIAALAVAGAAQLARQLARPTS